LDSRPLADSYLGRVDRPAAGPSSGGFAAASPSGGEGRGRRGPLRI